MYSVWQVEQISDCSRLVARAGRNPVAECMTRARGGGMSYGPNTSRSPHGRAVSILEFAVVLQPRTAVLKLVAERARHPVQRERIAAAAARAAAEAGKDLQLASGDVRLEARHRHVARGALVLDG